MKKIIIPLLLLTIFVSHSYARIGENRSYSIISWEKYNERIADGKDVVLNRFIIIPEFHKRFKEINDIRNENILLATYGFMLKKNKRKRLERYILSCDTTIEINKLIKGLYYFSKREYNEAIMYLKEFNDENYKFLKYLLLADCEFELLQDKSNYKKALQKYQVAYDLTVYPLEKELVNNRIKYIKYRK